MEIAKVPPMPGEEEDRDAVREARTDLGSLCVGAKAWRDSFVFHFIAIIWGDSLRYIM